MDVFGYLSGAVGTVGPIAGQMFGLKGFMATIPFGQMTVSTNLVLSSTQAYILTAEWQPSAWIGAPFFPYWGAADP